MPPDDPARGPPVEEPPSRTPPEAGSSAPPTHPLSATSVFGPGRRSGGWIMLSRADRAAIARRRSPLARLESRGVDRLRPVRGLCLDDGRAMAYHLGQRDEENLE
jgi:hypothetical protein